jgi:hypothetical protein
VLLKLAQLFKRCPITGINISLLIVTVVSLPFDPQYESGIGLVLFLLHYTVGILFLLSSEFIAYERHGPYHSLHVFILGLSLSICLDMVLMKLKTLIAILRRSFHG